MTDVAQHPRAESLEWYAAHIVMLFTFKDGRQNKFPVYEDIVLFKARSGKEARDKAVRYGKRQEGDMKGSLRWGEKPATLTFEGVRKVIECSVLRTRLVSGTEVTHHLFFVKSAKDLRKLVTYKSVELKYEE
jgi:hypothetical protein